MWISCLTAFISFVASLVTAMKHKVAYLVILCCLLLHISVIGSDNFLYHTLGRDGAVSILLSLAVAFLLYPLLGWLADVYFTRYKFILFSFITVIVGSILFIASVALFTKYTNIRQLYIAEGLSVAVCILGLGIFQSTAIQFGMDQMLEASTVQLSTFIKWYYWSGSIGPLMMMCVVTGVLEYFSQCRIELTTENPDEIYSDLHPRSFIVTGTAVLIMAGLQLVCACVGLCLLVYYKKHFNIDRTGEHPLKLIYQVLKYAWKHKCPENRSAFTYWEEDIPPRIDLGKSKYGGPFTTEEVEDTKTFFSILLLLLSLLGFHLSGHGYSVGEQLMHKQCPSHWVLLLATDPNYVILLIIVFGVPMYKLMTKYCSNYSPNMLKRMGMGLFLCVVKECVVIVIQVTMTQGEYCSHLYNNKIESCYFLTSEININNACLTASNFTNNFFHCDQNNTPFLLLLIPNVLQGLSYLLVFMTALEFICAQAPLRLKGLLIGIWYALLATNYLFVGVPELFMVDSLSWIIFHAIKVFLIFLFLILYLCVSKRYRYRLRDEVVNERFLVEEIFERRIDMAEQYEKKGEIADLIHSVENYEACNSTTVAMQHT